MVWCFNLYIRMVHVKINECPKTRISQMDLLTWVNRLCSSSLPQKVWSLTKSQNPEVCTQTPMKKPNSLRGLKTEAKLAKKDMAVVKVVAAVEEAALRLKSTETVAGSGWKVGFGWCLIIWYSYYACAKLWDSLICGGKKKQTSKSHKNPWLHATGWKWNTHSACK